jgi:LL-diaminopimelate aminotransferase
LKDRIAPPARRLAHFKPHFFATLGARIAQMQAEGVDVIRLDEGSPDLPPAPHIIEVLQQRAALPDRHGYQPHRGPRALREAWAELYQRLHGVELDMDREIVPLLGSKEGVFHIHLALVEPGDVVLAPDPGYITYTRGALIAGGELYYMALSPERDYLPELEAIPADILERAKLLWLNYPSNPTTAVANEAFFERAVEFARQHSILLCHDAAYTQVVFDNYRAPSILEAPGAIDVSVEFNTLSKSHNMAGWRTAALVGNPDVIGDFYRLKTNADSSHFLPVMEAATQALRGDQTWLKERNEIYRQRRDMVLDGLQALGLAVRSPCASLYVWSPVPSGWTCEDFALAALEEAHVSFTPGTVFGENGAGYVRFSLTAPVERVIEAMERLKGWMGK